MKTRDQQVLTAPPTALPETGDFGKVEYQHPTARGRRGRPRVAASAGEAVRLRDQGLSWRQVAKALNVGVETARRLAGVATTGNGPANAPTPSQNSGRRSV
jgi:DNA invertase Pin-like site-specific DNA recombinase